MGFSTPIYKGGSVLWMQIWLLVLALEPAPTVAADGFVKVQGWEATIADVMAVYEDMSVKLKALTQVIELVDGETPSAGAIVLQPYCITSGALAELLQQDLTGLGIYEELEAIDTTNATCTGERLGAAVCSAGHFVLGLIIKSESSGVERRNTRLYAPVPDTRPLVIACLRYVGLWSQLDAHCPASRPGSVRKAQRRGARRCSTNAGGYRWQTCWGPRFSTS
jgi:hypothetical protein